VIHAYSKSAVSQPAVQDAPSEHLVQPSAVTEVNKALMQRCDLPEVTSVMEDMAAKGGKHWQANEGRRSEQFMAEIDWGRRICPVPCLIGRVLA
jgi:hypothetical protein